MRIQTMLIAVLALFMAACSSTTTYQPAEKRGGYGYTETELGKDRYRVTFTGNTVTDKETVNDYALLRAAELTLQQGYDWFQLVNRDTESKSRTSSSISGVNDFGDWPGPALIVRQPHGQVLPCGLAGRIREEDAVPITASHGG